MAVEHCDAVLSQGPPLHSLASSSSNHNIARLDGAIAIPGGAIGGCGETGGGGCDVVPHMADDEIHRRNLSDQLVQHGKTDALVDRLLLKAQDAPPNKLLDVAIGQLIATQERGADIAHEANRLLKFGNNPDGAKATAHHIQHTTAIIRDHITQFLTDTKAITRLMLPSQSSNKYT